MWFHISRKYLGKKVVLEPRVPACCHISNKYLYEEGDIPHICVTDSIFSCLIAIMGTNKNTTLKDFKDGYSEENPCVYYSEERPYIPPNASDFRENHEMWYVKNTEFRYIGRVDLYYLTTKRILRPTTDVKSSFPYMKSKKNAGCYSEEYIKDIYMSSILSKIKI